MTRLSDTSTRLIANLVGASRRHAGWVIAGYVALTAASILWSLLKLQIDAGARDFMSPDLPWRQDAIALSAAFPEHDRSVVAVIDAPTPERGDAMRDQLRARFASVPGVAHIVSPGDGDFFARNGLLYLDTGALEDTASRIEQAQPFFGRLAEQPHLAGLASLLTQAYAHPDQTAGVPLARAAQRIADVIAASGREPPASLSWQGLLSQSDDAPVRSLLLAVPAQGRADDALVDALRAAAEATAKAFDPGVRVSLTGEGVMQADERDGIQLGVEDTVWSSLFGVAAILWFAMRSVSRAAICLGSTLVGLALTTGFAVIAVGRLTLISAAFGALYVGIAIAFSLHFCMRLEELRSEGLDYDAAMKVTARDVGTALLLSALATAAGFFAFVPTPYVAVRELGIISGTGLLIGFLVTMTLVPALLEKMPMPKARRLPGRRDDGKPPRTRHRGFVLAGAVAALVVSLALLTRIDFDYNPMHLTPQTEAFHTFQDLLKSKDTPLTATMLTADAGAAGAMAGRMAALHGVREARWLGSFVPKDQDDKLAIVDDLRLSVGATLPRDLALAAPDPDRDLAALRGLRIAAQQATGDAAAVAAAHALAVALGAWLDAKPDAAALGRLSNALLGNLPPLVHRLSTLLDAGPVTAADLPEDLRALWVSAHGEYRVDAVPLENLDDDRALVRFVDAVKGVAPHATGTPVEFVETTRAVIRAFAIAFSLALGAIALFLALLLGSVADALRALAPLILGTLILCATLVVLRHPLNMASIIGLPLLLGTNVDAAIHLILRAREAGTAHLSQTSTARAVVYLVLTEAVGYASLIVSPHRGIATLGELLTLGLGITLACIMLLLPALLPRTPARLGEPDGDRA